MKVVQVTINNGGRRREEKKLNIGADNAIFYMLIFLHWSKIVMINGTSVPRRQGVLHKIIV